MRIYWVEGYDSLAAVVSGVTSFCNCRNVFCDLIIYGPVVEISLVALELRSACLCLLSARVTGVCRLPTVTLLPAST